MPILSPMAALIQLEGLDEPEPGTQFELPGGIQVQVLEDEDEIQGPEPFELGLGSFLDTPPGVTAWHTIDPASYQWLADNVKDVWGLSKTEIVGRIDLAARGLTSQLGRVPSAGELLQYPIFTQYMDTLASGFSVLPPFFNFDGGLYFNDPLAGPTQITGESLKAEGISGSILTDLRRRQDIPTFDADQLSQLLGAGRRGRGGRRGGGRGGGGRAAIPFDRNQLIRGATEQLRSLLFEEPRDVEKIVDDYIKQANAFWRREGGQLDFETFVENQGLGSARARTLYRNKPEFMSHREYLSQFISTAGGFGLSTDTTRGLVERGAELGISQAAFGERVSRTREATVRNAGSFSQRLGAQAAQLAPMMR